MIAIMNRLNVCITDADQVTLSDGFVNCALCDDSIFEANWPQEIVDFDRVETMWSVYCARSRGQDVLVDYYPNSFWDFGIGHLDILSLAYIAGKTGSYSLKRGIDGRFISVNEPISKQDWLLCTLRKKSFLAHALWLSESYQGLDDFLIGFIKSGKVTGLSVV